MGGTSSQQQQQSSVSNPWAPAQPLLQGILGSAQGYLGNTGVTSPQYTALGTIENNANAANQFTPAINNVTSSLLAGGGALGQAGNIQNAYNQFQQNTNPLANNTNYNPYNTPGFSDALNTANQDITNNINGQFAAAGRDGSPGNSQALARGLSQGDAALIAQQYNQNVQNQQSAAGNLYNAGNTTSGLLTGLQQQRLANQQAGVGQVGSGLDASNAGANATIQAESAKLGIPAQNLSLLANLGIPIAGLGGQSSGTSNGTNTMSGAQQFATIMGGLGSFFGGGRR